MDRSYRWIACHQGYMVHWFIKWYKVHLLYTCACCQNLHQVTSHHSSINNQCMLAYHSHKKKIKQSVRLSSSSKRSSYQGKEITSFHFGL